MPEPIETELPLEKDPESSADATRTFKERIKEDIRKMEMKDNRETEVAEARKKVNTIAKPSYRSPGAILFYYCLIVAVATFIFSTITLVLVFMVLRWMAFDVDYWSAPIVALIPAILSPAAYIAYQFNNLFVQIGLSEAGVRRWWMTPVHEIDKDGKPDYTPLFAGYVLAPKPFYTVSVFPLDIQTTDITTHTISVQRMTDECDPEIEPVDEEEKKLLQQRKNDKFTTVTFGGTFTLEPDSSDFRSLILLYEFTEGMEKASQRTEKALFRAMQVYCSGPDGPIDQSQAIGMGEFAYKILKLFISKDLAGAGVIIQSMAPDIKLPEIQIKAIESANIEAAQGDKEMKHAMSTARSTAIAMTGNENMTPEELIAVLKANPLRPEYAAILTGRQNGTLGSESGISIKKIETGGTLSDAAMLIRELFNDGKEVEKDG